MNSDTLRQVLSDKDAQRESTIAAREITRRVFQQYPLAQTAEDLAAERRRIDAQVQRDIQALNAGRDDRQMSSWIAGAVTIIVFTIGLLIAFALSGCAVYYPLPNGGKVIFEPTLRDFKAIKELTFTRGAGERAVTAPGAATLVVR